MEKLSKRSRRVIVVSSFGDRAFKMILRRNVTRLEYLNILDGAVTAQPTNMIARGHRLGFCSVADDRQMM